MEKPLRHGASGRQDFASINIFHSRLAVDVILMGLMFEFRVLSASLQAVFLKHCEV